MPSTSPPGVCRIPQLTPVAKTGVPHDAPGPGQGPGHGAAKGSDTFGKVFLPGIPTDSWLSTKTLFSKVNPCPSGRIQAVLSPIFVTRATSCHSPGWMAGDGFRIRTAGVEMEKRHLPDSENRIREVTFFMSSCDEKLPAAQRLFHEHGSNTGQSGFREGAAKDAS